MAGDSTEAISNNLYGEHSGFSWADYAQWKADNTGDGRGRIHTGDGAVVAWEDISIFNNFA